MKVDLFPIEGLKLITLRTFPDDRGFFCERFKTSDFLKHQLPTKFVQNNFSRSKPGVLRGLHFQWDSPQGKLVTCLQGSIFDVAVDIRHGSPTFGQFVTVELSGDIPQWFWIPAGFAHGFCVLGEQNADVLYQCDTEYNGNGEGGIHWADSILKIDWPLKNPKLSSKDLELQSFQEYSKNPKFFAK